MRVVHISKTYKTKSQSVAALDGVSFDLPEKGMVFILGKSGSGKSTLLNVLSGLDRVDDGKIEICGKDIAKLSEEELCDYRNSCCGFVFQEYNLIPELSVGENVKLSLQLKGEKDVEEKVRKVLSRVELSGYEQRKVTELSGGQKQRVAIARAIVKEPEIIFADEPTGALDGQTGRSILDLLKEISKEKLVVVVSHDREFASLYGDRIIELSDGKVVSDNGIAEQVCETTGKKWQKPKMPIKAALKIGCSNFKYHPVRLVATILLSVMAFTLLGVSLNITMRNFEDVGYDAMRSSDMQYCKLIKCYNDFTVPIKQNEKSDIEKKVGNTVAVIDKAIDIELENDGDTKYYSALPAGYAQISSNMLKDFGFTVTGQLPNAENEIGLTKFSAGVINYLNFFEKKDKDIIGRTLNIDGEKYTITAIIDTNFDEDFYSDLKEESSEDTYDLQDSFDRELYSYLHNYIFVNDLNDFCENRINIATATVGFGKHEAKTRNVAAFAPKEPSLDVYVSDETKDGCYISAYNILPLMETVYCDIELDGERHYSYGSLIKALYRKEGGDENININLYLKTYKKYKDEYSFPTSFDCTVKDLSFGFDFDIKVTGFYADYIDDETIILSDELYKSVYEKIGGNYNKIFVNLDGRSAKQYIDAKGEYRLNSYILDQVRRYWQDITLVKDVAFILACAIAVMAISLLLNFMLQSVLDKTKIIGILKANGCNNSVLCKIFLEEGLVIALVVFVLSALIASGVCLILNYKYMGLGLFSINALIFPILLAVILVFSLLGCLIPILRLRKFLPNDIITKV